MRSLLAPLTLVSVALAQGPTNYHTIIGCPNLAARGTLGSMAGEFHTEVPEVDGVGHDASGSGTLALGHCCTLQDQNAATQEIYSFVVRSDSGGAPNPAAAGVLLQSGPFTSPVGVGTMAWNITVTLSTPSTALPLCQTYYHGVHLAANPLLPTDGLSLQVGSYYLLGGSQGDNPAPVGPRNIAWNVRAGAASQPAPFGIRLGLGVAAAVLTLGNTDPTLIGSTTNCVASLLNPSGHPRSHGAGGIWPRIGGARHDGLDVRVADRVHANGIFAAFLGTSLGCPGLPLAGVANGALYLNPAFGLVAVASGALDGAGIGEAIVIPPGTAPVSILNQWVAFQALAIGPAFTLPGNLTNLARVQFLP